MSQPSQILRADLAVQSVERRRGAQFAPEERYRLRAHIAQNYTDAGRFAFAIPVAMWIGQALGSLRRRF